MHRMKKAGVINKQLVVLLLYRSFLFGIMQYPVFMIQLIKSWDRKRNDLLKISNKKQLILKLKIKNKCIFNTLFK